MTHELMHSTGNINPVDNMIKKTGLHIWRLNKYNLKEEKHLIIGEFRSYHKSRMAAVKYYNRISK